MSFLLIIVPLVVLLTLTLFSFIFNATYVSTAIEGLISTDLINNGSTTTIVVGGDTQYFSLDPLLGALGWVVVIVIIATAIGIRVLGSGVADMSIRTIILTSFYIAVFSILSLYGFPYIMSIPYNFGLIIYLMLTSFFAIGIFKQVSGGDS